MLSVRESCYPHTTVYQLSYQTAFRVLVLGLQGALASTHQLSSGQTAAWGRKRGPSAAVHVTLTSDFLMPSFSLFPLANGVSLSSLGHAS